MHRLQEPKRRVVVSHRRASTRVNNVVLQTFNQDIDIVAKQKMIYIYTLDKHPKDELSSYFFGACITFHTYGSIASIG